MNDYLVKYNNQTQLDADNLPGKHGHTDELGVFQWLSDHAMVVKAWRPSQDSTDQDGNVVHNYLPGIWVLIAVPKDDADVEASGNLQMSFNRAKCNAKASGCLKYRKAGGPPQQDIKYEPVYAGANVPFDELD